MTKRPLVLVLLFYVLFLLLARPYLEGLDRRRTLLAEGKTVEVTGIIDSDPLIYDDSVGFDLDLSGFRIKTYSPRFDCEYGQKIKLKGMVLKQEGPRNPGISGKESRWIIRALGVPQVISGDHYNPFKKAIFSTRKFLLNVVSKCFAQDEASLLSGLLFGKAAAGISPEIKEEFKRTGTVHLLVVSGLHLSILVGTLYALFSMLRLPSGIILLLATLANVFYMLLAGGAPSVMRAALMAELTLLARFFNRDKDFFTGFSLAALVILLLDPLSLFNLGFQLSFSATFALVCLAPVIKERLNILPDWASSLVSVSLAPYIMTFPLIYFNFSQVSLVAPLANLLILPWISFLIILGFISVAAGSLSVFLGQFMAASATLLIKFMNLVVSFFAKMPFTCIYLPPPPFLCVLIYYLLLFYLIKKRFVLALSPKQLRYAATLIALFAVMVAGSHLLGIIRSPLEIVVLDVGQGDSIFIKSPTGRTLLIDGGDNTKGRDMGARVVVPFLQKKGVNKLDLVVLTHPHGDHVGGLPEVLKKIKVGLVVDPGQKCDSALYAYFKKLIAEKKIPFRVVRRGDEIDLGEGILAKVLHPRAPPIEESALNNNSIVLRLVYKDFSMLLCGDLEIEGEEDLIKCGIELKSRIIKVGHHGSKTASSKSFLRAVSPELAVISCGKKNKFGHPHKAALKKLQDQRIRILRTDKNGAVTIKTNGKKVNTSPLTLLSRLP